MKKLAPLGIKLLCYTYRVNVLFFLLSLLLFYNRIFILGKKANIWISWIIRLILFFLPVCLSFHLRQLKKVAWILALSLHTFFIINNVSLFLEYYGHTHSFFRITGIYSSIFYSPSQVIIIALNIAANLFITGYLFRKKRYFYPDAIKPRLKIRG